MIFTKNPKWVISNGSLEEKYDSAALRAMQATAIKVRKPRHFQASQEERNRQRHKSENSSGKQRKNTLPSAPKNADPSAASTSRNSTSKIEAV